MRSNDRLSAERLAELEKRYETLDDARRENVGTEARLSRDRLAELEKRYDNTCAGDEEKESSEEATCFWCHDLSVPHVP